MSGLLKQSTSTVITFGPFVDKTDGVTLKTGLVSALDHASTGIMLSKNGGTLAVRHATVTATTYDAHGCYKVTLDTTDTNTLGRLRVIYTDASTCLPVWRDFDVVPAQVYDSLVSGSDLLDCNASQLGGTNQTGRDVGASVLLSAGSGAGQLDFTAGVVKSNLTQMGGGAQSATDLKDFADTGYDPSTHKVQGVVLADTVTTLTGHTAQTGDAYARLGAPAGASMAADIAAIPAAVWAAGTRTLTSFGTLVADVAAAVWAAGTRTLSAFGFTVATNSDSNVTAILADTNELQTDWVNGGRLDLLLDGVKAKTDLIPAAPAATGDIPTAAAIAAAHLDLADGIETGLTPRQAMRLITAALAGKLSGAATTTITIRNTADSKTRITATVDADGNRSATTFDLS